MRNPLADHHLVAVLAPYGRDPCDYGRLRERAAEVGLEEDGAFVARLDRVVIEMLLREYLPSGTARERIIPALLARRVLLSWWRPEGSQTAAREACAFVAASPDVFCAGMVARVVRNWAMGTLVQW